MRFHSFKQIELVSVGPATVADFQWMLALPKNKIELCEYEQQHKYAHTYTHLCVYMPVFMP